MNAVRLGHPARIHGKILSSCLDQKIKSSSLYREIERLRNELTNQNKNYKEGSKKDYSIYKELREYEDLVIKEVVNEASIVCSTNTGVLDKVLGKVLKDLSFDVIIIDECAQS